MLANEQLIEIGRRIRTERKSLGISAIATSEAAGISRVTLHRIEKGVPSVTIGRLPTVETTCLACSGSQCLVSGSGIGYLRTKCTVS